MLLCCYFNIIQSILGLVFLSSTELYTMDHSQGCGGRGPSSNTSLNEIIFDQNDLNEGLLLNSNQ